MAKLSDSLKTIVKDTVGDPMLRIQTAIERIILYSRYILVVFYIGLAFALAVYAVSFIFEVLHVAELALTHSQSKEGTFNMVMPILELIDGALVSGLIVMVMLSSYENFVGRFGDEALDDSPEWLRRLDPGSRRAGLSSRRAESTCNPSHPRASPPPRPRAHPTASPRSCCRSRSGSSATTAGWEWG